MQRFSSIANSSSISNSLVESRDIALEHRLTVVLPDDVRIERVNAIVIHSVLHIEES